MPRFGGRLIEHFATLTLLTLICSTDCAQTQPVVGEKPLLLGQIIERVQCGADRGQSYALYLPSRYSPTQAWPIVYTYDPMARGSIPLALYKTAAEKYGFILAASNNSRNFEPEEISKAAQAMWTDTHVRLRVDPRRIYTMGFSGGARVATLIALRCATCAVAGVIVHGAAYPDSILPSEKDHFAYFAFIGDRDFNWPELMELQRKKERWNAPFHVRVYDGDHQWAPPGIFDEALEWLQLKAMQTGTAPPDASFIDQMLARTQKAADEALQHKNAIAEFEAYRSLTSDFSGLKDVSPYQTRLRELNSTPELKQARKKEQEAIDHQHAIVSEISSKLSRVEGAEPKIQVALRNDIVDAMTGLRNKADHATNDETRLIYLRAFDELWAQGFEKGQAEFQINRHFDKAVFYFQLISSITPNEPSPFLLLAETNAMRGERKRALKDLREAVKRGLRFPESVENNANLQVLRSEPEFQQIVAELKARRQSPPASEFCRPSRNFRESAAGGSDVRGRNARCLWRSTANLLRYSLIIYFNGNERARSGSTRQLVEDPATPSFRQTAAT